jgi:hypothetical protein
MTLTDERKVEVRNDLPPGADYDFIRDYAGQPIAEPAEALMAPHLLFIRQYRSLLGFDH